MLQPVDWAGKPNSFSVDLPFALGFTAFGPTYGLTLNSRLMTE